MCREEHFVSHPALGLTIRVEGRRQPFIRRDIKSRKEEECTSGGQVLIVFRSRVPLGAAATAAGATGAAVFLAPHELSTISCFYHGRDIWRKDGVQP